MTTNRMIKEQKQPQSDKRIELVADYFDQHADYWSAAYQRPQTVGDLVLANRNRIAVDFVSDNLRPGAKVLDAGCGAGPTTLALIQSGFVVHAVDISKKMLHLCERNLAANAIAPDKYSLEQIDLMQASLPEASFDAIVALGFLQYQSDEHHALSRLHKLLKPGGILVVSGPVKIKLSEYFGLAKLYYAIANRIRKIEPNEELAVLHQISTHYYGVGRFKRVLRDAGFVMLKHQGHGFINFAVIRDWTARGQHLLHRFFTRLSKVLPIGRFGNDMVVVAKKSEAS